MRKKICLLLGFLICVIATPFLYIEIAKFLRVYLGSHFEHIWMNFHLFILFIPLALLFISKNNKFRQELLLTWIIAIPTIPLVTSSIQNLNTLPNVKIAIFAIAVITIVHACFYLPILIVKEFSKHALTLPKKYTILFMLYVWSALIPIGMSIVYSLLLNHRYPYDYDYYLPGLLVIPAVIIASLYSIILGFIVFFKNQKNINVINDQT